MKIKFFRRGSGWKGIFDHVSRLVQRICIWNCRWQEHCIKGSVRCFQSNTNCSSSLGSYGNSSFVIECPHFCWSCNVDCVHLCACIANFPAKMPPPIRRTTIHIYTYNFSNQPNHFVLDRMPSLFSFFSSWSIHLSEVWSERKAILNNSMNKNPG